MYSTAFGTKQMKSANVWLFLTPGNKIQRPYLLHWKVLPYFARIYSNKRSKDKSIRNGF